jgi:hypothetical protein
MGVNKPHNKTKPNAYHKQKYKSKLWRRVARARDFELWKMQRRRYKRHPAKVDDEGNVVVPERPRLFLPRPTLKDPTRATGALKRHERKSTGEYFSR